MDSLPWLTTEGSAFLPLLFAVGFVFLCVALGRRLLILFGAAIEGAHVERGVIAACLGAGILQFVPFALGAAGQLNVTALRAAAAVITMLAVPDLFAVIKNVVAFTRTERRPDAWLVAWVLALAPAALMATLIALAPSLDPDGLAYHLTVPKRWMNTGHLDFLPTYPYSNAPMGMEMLFAWAMALVGDSGAKCVHLAMGLLAVVALYLAGKRLRGRMTGAVAATLFLVGPAAAALILGFSYVEGGASLATATAALAWLIWYQTNTRGFLRVAALLAGIAVSLKITTALFPIALGALSILAIHQHLRDTRIQRPFIGSLAATASLIPLVAAPVVPWLLRAFVVTGNPFFPVLANRIPSRDYSAELATKVDSFNRYMTWGNTIGRDWTLDQRTHLLFAVGLAVLAVGLFACFKLRRRMARGTAVILTITIIGQLSATGLFLRYSIPVAAVFTLLLAALFEKWLAWRPVMIAWVAITLACSLVQARRSFIEEGADLSGLMTTLAGTQHRSAFLDKRLPLYPLYQRVNRDLPTNAGIMLSFYCAGFYMDRTTFCAEMVQDSLRFTTPEEFVTDLRRLGITHLLAPSALATNGPTPYLGGSSVSVLTREQQFGLVRQLLTKHARTVQTAADFGLYEIDPVWLKNIDATL